MLPNNLNPSQKKAVEYNKGHLLIVAGPGTGKTHTLTHRIAVGIKNLSDGQKILAITFTKKAAGEMQGRLLKFLAGREEKVFVGTFHQFCLSVLRQYSKDARLPGNFRVASPEDVEEIAKDLWPDMKGRERRLRLEEVSRWKSVRFLEPASLDVVALNNSLRQKWLVDFDDLLLETLNLLRFHINILNQVQNSFPYIFVDEYQDINAVQHALLKILVGSAGRITAIGDPNQAIYGFRGSDARFFESFLSDFPGAKILSLEENYRSSQNLLSASGQVMAKMKSLHVPELTAKIYQEGQLTVYEAATDKAEAEYVVHQIEKLVGGTSMFSQDSGRVSRESDGELSFGDIAVLYRLNSQRHALKEAFERSGIPYHISGENTEKGQDELLADVYFDRTKEVAVVAEKVSLMTLHAAKGLEFPCVFIIGCEQNILPLNLEGMTSDVEEERRLFYVGMTRAKKRLYLLRAKRRLLYGQAKHNAPSPFLSDIEEELKEYEVAVRKTQRRKRDDQQMSLF